MDKEQKQELINVIVGILHENAGTMYEAKGNQDEPRIALDEDYFEDVSESVFNYCENMFSQKHRKESSGLKTTETKTEARKKAVTLENLLNYSDYGPRITENEYYNAMIEMKNLVLVLTNDIEYSDIVEARKSNTEAMRGHAIGFAAFFSGISKSDKRLENVYAKYTEYLTTLKQ